MLAIGPDTSHHPAMYQTLLRVAGLLFVGLAGLGALLPVLPTTPFLLLASYCFVRSSPAWNERLLRTPVFGPLLIDWQQKGGVRAHVKLTAVSTICCVIGMTLWLGQLPPLGQALLLLFAGIGLVVVLRLPVVTGSSASNSAHVKSLLETALSTGPVSDPQ